MPSNRAPDTETLVVVVPKELHAAVKDRARTDDLTMSQLVRAAIRDYLSREKTPAA